MTPRPPRSTLSLSDTALMRTLALVALLALAVPARAQRASDVPTGPAPVVLSETPGALGIGQLFNAQTLDFRQSYEASYGVSGAGSLGTGLYTASLLWQPSDKLAGRVDLGVLHGLGGTPELMSATNLDGSPQVFLRNAELAYRPTDALHFSLSVSQSPYGTYAAPYGYGGRYARYRPLGASPSGDLFFRDAE